MLAKPAIAENAIVTSITKRANTIATIINTELINVNVGAITPPITPPVFVITPFITSLLFLPTCIEYS